MAIRYVIQQRKNPRDPSAQPKYYLIAKTFAPVGRKFLLEDMVDRTSLTKQEAVTALDYLFEVLPRLVSMGFTVKLGELGHFRISIRSEGSDTPEEATESKVKSKRLLFIPGREIHDLIQRIPVEEYGLRSEI
jgi:predicted histone-like DNA-binding protein